MRLTFRVTILSVVVLLSGGCKEQEPGSAVSVLLTAKVRFSDDGAGGSIPELMEQPQVKALLDRPGIWRELVNHLDSTELTGGTFQLQSGTSEEPSVPLGFYCLDILLNCVDIGHRNSVFWDYGDDGLWSMVREDYYFPPDVLLHPKDKAKMRAVRAAWEALYKETKGSMFTAERWQGNSE